MQLIATFLAAALAGVAYAARPGSYGGWGNWGGYTRSRGAAGYGGAQTTSCKTSSTCSPTSKVTSSIYSTPVYRTVTKTVYIADVVTTEYESTYYDTSTCMLSCVPYSILVLETADASR